MNVADLVFEITATAGTGPLTMGGARSVDFRTVHDAYEVGDTFPYTVRGGGQFETGMGTYSGGGIVARTEVYNGSSGPGVLVDFAAGNKDFYVCINSGMFVKPEDLPSLELPVVGTDEQLIFRGGELFTTPASAILDYIESNIVVAPPADSTAPIYSSAQVTNSAKSDIVLTFSETLGAFTPAASAFAVSGGKTVSSVARSGAAITLTVNSAYAYGDTITVTYTKPGSNPLQDAAGNQTASFGPSSVTNNIAAPGDVTAPTVNSAAVANATPAIVAIAISEALDGAFVPAASAFTVSGHTVSSVAIAGSTINLTVSAAFVNGEAARTVAYTQPGTNNARDIAGNLLVNFSGVAITNNVAASGTMADSYTLTSGVNSANFPSTATFEGGTAPNQYKTSPFNIYIKNGSAYPAASTVLLCWGKSTTTPPVTWTGSAWPTSVPYTSNGGSSGNVPNSTKLGIYTNEGSYPGMFSPESSLYAGGSAGTFYLWVLFPDGSSKALNMAWAIS